MNIRPSRMEDLNCLMEIYEEARAFMRQSGNRNQWVNGYPNRELLSEDIRRGVSFLCEENGNPVGCFTFIIGEDPTYQVIEGRWLNEGLYGTIHRAASNGTRRGLMDEVIAFCAGRAPNLRCDTHADNHPMQKVMARCGFTHCGTIWVEDGTPRLAYQKIIQRAEEEKCSPS